MAFQPVISSSVRNSTFFKLTFSMLQARNPTLSRDALEQMAHKTYQVARRATPGLDDTKFESVTKHLGSAHGLLGDAPPPTTDEFDPGMMAFYAKAFTQLSPERQQLSIRNARALETIFPQASDEETEHPCAKCLRTVEKMKKCGRCRTTWYCSKECQRQDWPRHKRVDCLTQLEV